MYKSESYSKRLLWFIPLLLSAFLTGCGGGGSAPILGSNTAPPVSSIAPGGTCPVTGLAVTASNPGNGESSVATSTSGDANGGKSITATFNTAVNPATITPTSFTLTPAGGTALTSTSVSYSADVATLTTAAALAPNVTYTAFMSTTVTSAAGAAMGCSYQWSFTTGSAVIGAAPGNLGTAAHFGDLGGAAGTTNTGINTLINGDLGSTATATTSITGFNDTAGDVYTEAGTSNKGTVNGTIYTCTTSTTGPTAAAVNASYCSTATQALADAQTAYNNLSPAALPGGTDPGAGQLGGLTLAPGVYKAAGGSFLITGSDLTLNGNGNPNATFVFQMATTLTVGAAGAPRNVILINGAQAKNVFWQVGSSATINAAGGGTMVGTILASAAVSFSTTGSTAYPITTLNGRAVAINASETMNNTNINVPAP